jgi:hypothetical protein
MGFYANPYKILMIQSANYAGKDIKNEKIIA